jgi:hypothetical protein
MYSTHLGIRFIPKRFISCLFEKVDFLDLKTLLSPFGRGKKTFSSTLNVMISQMIRNESVRFGRHIDIGVSYKILQLEMPIGSNFAQFGLLSKGLFGSNFELKHPWSLRG